MTLDEMRWEYATISDYKPAPDSEDWSECPRCARRPRVWIFDNGRYAKCQCGSKYDGAEVSAKPIGDHVRETDGFLGYDNDELRKNWNSHVANLPNAKLCRKGGEDDGSK